MVRFIYSALAVCFLLGSFGPTALAHDHMDMDLYERANVDWETCTSAAVDSEANGFQLEDTTHVIAVCQAALADIELEYARASDLTDYDRSFRDNFRVTMSHMMFLSLWHENNMQPNSSACGILDSTVALVDRAEFTDDTFRADGQRIRTELIEDYRPKCRSAGH